MQHTFYERVIAAGYNVNYREYKASIKNIHLDDSYVILAPKTAISHGTDSWLVDSSSKSYATLGANPKWLPVVESFRSVFGNGPVVRRLVS